LFSTTRTALPSLRATVFGAITSTSVAIARLARSRSATRVRSPATSGRSGLTSPHWRARPPAPPTSASRPARTPTRPTASRQGEAGEDGLDVRGVDVDPADHQHVVGAPLDPGHPRQRAAAATGLARERREVAGPVAEDRERLLGEAREDELPFPPGCERHPGRR